MVAVLPTVTMPARGTHSRLAPGRLPIPFPHTDLGRKLFAIRRRIEASGVPMLTESEMLAEVRRRRGGTRTRRRLLPCLRSDP
jgi:hypothetical protein